MSKNKLKISSLALTALVAVSTVQANNQNGIDPAKVFKDAARGDKHDKTELYKLASKESLGDTMKAIQNFFVSEKTTIKQAELFDDFFMASIPNSNAYWKGVAKLNGFKIQLSKRLIDVNRVQFVTPGYVEKLDENNRSTGMIDWQSPIVDEKTKTSHTLMEQGMPPIGPDSYPIVVCRLIDSPDATYYEFSELDFEAAVKHTHSPLSKRDACLSDAWLSDHWKNRLKEQYSKSLSLH